MVLPERYEDLGLLGMGGMAVVHSVRDTVFNRVVAGVGIGNPQRLEDQQRQPERCRPLPSAIERDRARSSAKFACRRRLAIIQYRT